MTLSTVILYINMHAWKVFMFSDLCYAITSSSTNGTLSALFLECDSIKKHYWIWPKQMKRSFHFHFKYFCYLFKIYLTFKFIFSSFFLIFNYSTCIDLLFLLFSHNHFLKGETSVETVFPCCSVVLWVLMEKISPRLFYEVG